jgi:NitT/TauT family transport system substrate-binding protein
MHERRYSVMFILAALLVGAAPAHAAETIKIGVVGTTGAGPFYLAQDKGYFAAAGLEVTFVNFDAAQIVTQATVTGDVDIGAAAVSAAFYNLAAKGEIKFVGGLGREVPGFNGTAFLASNRAWDAGLTSLKDLAHHSIAVPQVGGPLHYDVALLAEKYGLDIKTIRILPLQTIPNVVSAVIGGQPDAGLMPSTFTIQLVERHQAHLLGWVGNETPWQLSAIFVATRTADRRGPMIKALLQAYRRGAHDYRTAFAGADGKRQDGPTAPSALAVIAKYLDQPVPRVAQAIGDDDPDARLDIPDIRHQVAWFKSQGMLPADADTDAMIDRRYVLPLDGD